MSRSKTRYCDCCGNEIPYNEMKTHMEYDGHIAHSMTYIATDDGNKEWNWLSKRGDKIFGLVDLNLHRNREESTVIPGSTRGSRCMDICNKCKIRFLENTIKYLKKYKD